LEQTIRSAGVPNGSTELAEVLFRLFPQRRQLAHEKAPNKLGSPTLLIAEGLPTEVLSAGVPNGSTELAEVLFGVLGSPLRRDGGRWFCWRPSC
jgi:hypothetical protein